MFEVGSIVARLKGDISDFKSSMNEAKSLGANLKDGFKAAEAGSFALLGGVTAVAVGAAAFGVSSVKAFNEAEAASAQLDAVLQSTGHAAGLFKEDLTDQATALQAVTKFSDEAVMATQAMLLTFTNIHGPVMQKATETALDMAQALGMDGKQAALQLGKALNDPSEGLSKLTRIGVTFSAEQEKQVKAMQAAGDVAGAQGVILQELQKEFGGSARAAGETFAGKLEILKNQFGDLQEAVGEVIINAMRPLLDVFGQFIKDMNEAGGLLPYFTKLFHENETAIYMVVGAIIVGLIPAFVAMGAAIWAALAPLLPFLAAGAALGLLFKTLKDNGIDPLKIGLDLLRTAWDFLRPSVMALWAQIQSQLMPALQQLWGMLGPVLVPALQYLALFLGGVLVGNIYLLINVLRVSIAVFSAVVGAVNSVVGAVGNMGRAAINAANSFGGALYGAGRALVQGLVNGINSMAGEVGRRISEIANGAVNTAKRILGIKSPSTVFMGIGQNLGMGMAIGIDAMTNQVQDAVNAMVPTSLDLAGGAGGTQVQTNIYGNIVNGSEADRDIFFKRLSRGQEVAARGAALPTGMAG